MSKIKRINNEIDIAEMWEGLGGDFENIQQIICEFLDNSVSNLTGKNSEGLENHNINVIFKVENDNNIMVRIEDTGTGIVDLDNALKIGNKSVQESPLNEHGFGLKHALAAADKTNNSWKIYTKTIDDKKHNEYELIQAPYKTENWTANIINEIDIPWPGSYTTTGTIIEFVVNKELLSTLTNGIPGANINTSYERMIDYLIEDLSFIYSKVLENTSVKMSVKLYKNHIETKNVIITPLQPSWIANSLKAGEELCDLGNGIVKIEYQFGSIEAGDNMRYYKKNMSSSGVEIRINGRALAYNLFTDIWHKEKHNCYNHFIGRVNVISEHRESLPETKTAKNAFKTSDKKYEELLRWISQKHPNIEEIEESNDSFNEVSLFKTLATNMKTYSNPNDTITTEQYVFKEEMKLRIDLYQCSNNNVTIYEGKKIKTTPKDVYQLRMYWDGLVYEGMKPNKGILIGSVHPDSVKNMIEYVNKMKDANGNNYNFETVTWEEKNIPIE